MHGTLHSKLSRLPRHHMQRHIPNRDFLPICPHRHQHKLSSYAKTLPLRSTSPILDTTTLTTGLNHLT